MTFMVMLKIDKGIHFCHDLPVVMQLFDLNNLTGGEDG